MSIKRRDFLRLSAGNAALLYGLPTGLGKMSALDGLKPMISDVAPISLQERQMRVEKAQRLMAESKNAAIVLDCGTSMQYFTGVGWWPSERTMVAVIPAHGDVSYVCPAFE